MVNNIVRKRIIYKYLMLLGIIFITGIIIYESANLRVQILAFASLALFSAILVGFDIMHPYCWFSGMFLLYSLGYPILYYTGNLDPWLIEKAGISQKLIFLEWVALSIILLIVSPDQVSHVNKTNKTVLFTKANKLLYIIMYAVILSAVVSISQRGFMHKREIYAANNPLYKLSFIIIYMLLVIYVYACIHYIDNFRFRNRFIFFTFLLTFLITMFSGERDILFMYLLLTIFVLYISGTIKKQHFFLLIPLGMIALPLSSIYKGFFLTGVANGGLTYKNFIKQFFNSEFRSASANMQILLNHEEEVKNIFSYTQVLKDIKRIFIGSTESTLGWFNDKFFSYTKTKYGFTLVGEGYVIGGILGIVVIFLIIGVLIRFLYHMSSKNIYYKTLYICSIPRIIYAIRADLTNIFSPILKHIILTLLVIFIVQKLFIYKSYNLKKILVD